MNAFFERITSVLILLMVVVGCDNKDQQVSPISTTASVTSQSTNPQTRTNHPPEQVRTQKLVTPGYEITLTFPMLEEGHVAYSGIRYHGVSHKTGKSIDLIGSTYHLHDAQGTPTRFLGYQFTNGDVTYTILDEGHLIVTRGRNQMLVNETGTWQSQPTTDMQ